MKIITFVDWGISCTYTTLGWGIQGLPKYLNCETKLYDYNTELKTFRIDSDSSNDIIVVFEIGNPQHAGLNTEHLRYWFPNAKLVALCCDTQYYQYNNLNPQMNPAGIDLHLELTISGCEWLKSKGAPNVDWWLWSISDKLIDFAYQFKKKYNNGIGFHKDKKTTDFIGVYHPGTISNKDGWRYKAIKHLESNNLTFTQGGGCGHEDTGLERLFEHYIKSWFTLGTTSHNRPELTEKQGSKFFRDELGPILDSLLIYDGCENTRRKYGDASVPFYDYYNNESIIDIYKKLHDKPEYYELLNKQKTWVLNNSFEQRLIKTLLKHKFISDKDLKCT